MKECKPISTPITSSALDKDENGKLVDKKLYRGMIYLLLYLTASQPNIVFSVGMCARYQSNPKESHLKAIKRILRYVKGSKNLGLFYPKSKEFNLTAYTDADYGGCKIDRKSTSGICHFLGNSLVSWGSKKKNTIALSSTKDKYVAASLCCTQVLWIKHQLEDYGIHLDRIPIKCDDTSIIALSKNPVFHTRTKHIGIKYHFLRGPCSKRRNYFGICGHK